MNNKYYLIACGVLIAQISIYASNNDGGGAITPRQQLIPRGRSRSVPDILKTIYVPLKKHGQGKTFDFAKPRQAIYQVESFIREEQRKKENLKALVKEKQGVIDNFEADWTRLVKENSEFRASLNEQRFLITRLGSALFAKQNQSLAPSGSALLAKESQSLAPKRQTWRPEGKYVIRRGVVKKQFTFQRKIL